MPLGAPNSRLHRVPRYRAVRAACRPSPLPNQHDTSVEPLLVRFGTFCRCRSSRLASISLPPSSESPGSSDRARLAGRWVRRRTRFGTALRRCSTAFGTSNWGRRVESPTEGCYGHRGTAQGASRPWFVRTGIDESLRWALHVRALRTETPP